ncbi:MAG: helix-turn-helix domain-containing protein [Solirubrobacterales bacterium]|nr:helix-turn-helix domain-containing protein [Solirubrobacterales bacterium]
MQRVIDSGRFSSASEWAKTAGIARSHVGTLMSRARSGGSMSLETAAMLANVAGITLDWLALGVGPQRRGESDAVVPDGVQIRDRYPARASAVQRARAAGLDEDSIAAVVTGPAYNLGEFTDRSSDWWYQEIRAHSAKHRAQQPIQESGEVAVSSELRQTMPAPGHARRR